MPLAARLAVLSACETGLGQQSGGEGVLGLPWAFRAAGCPTVVASLWDVDANRTSDLMIGFYRALYDRQTKRSLPVDEALRRAALRMIHDPRTKSAYDWAAFQVYGDTRPLEQLQSIARR